MQLCSMRSQRLQQLTRKLQDRQQRPPCCDPQAMASLRARLQDADVQHAEAAAARDASLQRCKVAEVDLLQRQASPPRHNLCCAQYPVHPSPPRLPPCSVQDHGGRSPPALQGC